MMQRLQQKLSQKQVLAPRQILLAKLLQLNGLNLRQRILDELEKNPVLDEVPRENEQDNNDDSINNSDIDASFEADEPEPSYLFKKPGSDVEIQQAYSTDFIEDLIQQIDIYGLNDSQIAIAEEILWNLDDRGYFTIEMELIADRLNANEAEVEKVLNLIQHLDPPGIAATDLKECLLIQLDNQQNSTAYHIISKYFDDFINKRYNALQKKIGCPENELSEAIDVIKHLNPRPGEGKITGRDEMIVPDIIIRERDDDWSIQIYDSGLPELKMNPDYIGLMEESTHISPDAKKYIREQTDSANWFIEAIKQRRNTMIRVMKAIIERQPKFFSGNINELMPMKLQDIAEDVEMDISTISRSTRGKYVDTSFGIFELKSFFTEGTQKESGEVISTNQVKDTLSEIIDGENKQKPVNDDALVNELKEKGYNIARRTVAKYREQLNIPVARLRKEI